MEPGIKTEPRTGAEADLKIEVYKKVEKIRAKKLLFLLKAFKTLLANLLSAKFIKCFHWESKTILNARLTLKKWLKKTFLNRLTNLLNKKLLKL